ncbi:pyrophosphatase [Psychrobacter sp. JB193]|uniref:pyrophosphatase n=1 Tax=Psychrobacter sp. JB193 TaxID=2024406 RepID=UPI000BAB1EDE|nr:pyrophosphatase [Psychrobacter sp. JB193]PAT64492.1 hypothetical protein CIK80_05280 [Psychrobacter sp. JB193]
MGDIFWYFILIIIVKNIDFNELFESTESFTAVGNELLITDIIDRPIVQVNSNITASLNEEELFIKLINRLVRLNEESNLNTLRNFLDVYLQFMSFLELNLLEIVERNKFKIRDRFIDINKLKLPELCFDDGFDSDEQLPINFEVHIIKKSNGKSYLKWNNVFIGSALNDNHQDSDNYKYHDVFHLAFAAVLHWSPTFRALIKHKRKSEPSIDENQDSGRPIVIEEGLSAWLFSMSKENSIDFTQADNISYDLLKTIRIFVKGYEVEKCPLQLWVKAITLGYSVFNQVVENEGGIIIGNRKERTLKYKSFKGNET